LDHSVINNYTHPTANTTAVEGNGINPEFIEICVDVILAVGGGGGVAKKALKACPFPLRTTYRLAGLQINI
jgi:hypothetical protein